MGWDELGVGPVLVSAMMLVYRGSVAFVADWCVVLVSCGRAGLGFLRVYGSVGQLVWMRWDVLVLGVVLMMGLGFWA